MLRSIATLALLIAPIAATPAAEPVRLVIALEGGPLLVDLYLTLDGRPYEEGRNALVDEMLELADSDGDGAPTWGEAILNPRFSLRVPGGDRGVRQFDTDGDRAMSRDEARALIERYGGGPALVVAARPTASIAAPLRALLDTDDDGALSKDELDAAERLLKSHDANDDDVLEIAELAGGLLGNAAYYQRNGFRGGGAASQPPGVVAVREERDLEDLRRVLLARYGKDGTVSAAQWSVVSELFRRLDGDQDGSITGTDIGALRTAPSHLTIDVNIGQEDAAPVGVAVNALAAPVDREGAELGERRNQLALQHATSKLVFRAAADAGRVNYRRTAETILQRADVDKNGYFDEKELEGNQGLQYYLQQFDTFDQNGDGKVFVDEIETFYERQQAPRRTQVSLQLTELRPTLFDGLDVDGDRRLSLRELRQLRERFAKLDANGDRRVEGDELPGEITFSFGRSGAANFGARPVVRINGGGIARPVHPASNGAPRWFQAMDTNSDGDVTPREFLGSPAQFAKLDANEDGFVDLDEAKAADEATKADAE